MTESITVRVVVQQNVIKTVVKSGIKGDKGETGTGIAWITLTQAEYDALTVPEQNDPLIVYNISDA